MSFFTGFVSIQAWRCPFCGAGRKYAPERDAVADVIEERANEEA